LPAQKNTLLKRFWQQLTHWELWPFYVIYLPLSILWLYYSIRAGRFWFCSNVDPTIEFSGFEGESKREMYEQLPKHLYPTTIYVTPCMPLQKILEQMKDAGIVFPCAAKPEVGMQALMFRKIYNEQQLAKYHAHMPGEYLVQSMVELPMEFSVFHVRYPDEQKGKITGFILKEYLSVTGDGTSTLLQLIKRDERACLKEEEMRHRHASHLNDVIPAGKKYLLSIAGNHNRGARFINLSHEIDDQLCSVFDAISLENGYFYYGRYDLKCTSIADLKAGRNIQILEFNGTGAEPNHIYDCGMPYSKALRVIASHWRDMYRISRINYKKGIPYWNFGEGRKYLKKASLFFTVLKKVDLDLEL
jgi:hypothetical protein